MINNKMIIICPSMWPDMNMWGETQRMYYLANYLADQGWQITVISPSYQTVHRNPEIKEQKYTNLYLGSIIDKKKHGQAAGALSQDGMMRKVKRQISNIINRCGEWIYGEPDIIEVLKKVNWVKNNRNEICRVVREEKVEKVMISIPSFTFMKLGRIIKKECGNVTVFYDYRDPWYLWKHKKNLAYYRERFYLKYADCIVGFSEKFRDGMIKEMGVYPDRIYTVYNGYSEQEWMKFEESQTPPALSGASAQKGKMIMTYTGSMSLNNKKNNYRNPANLIAAVKGISNVELYLVGLSRIDKEITEENVHYIGEVTQQQSFSYMEQSDILISIHDADDQSGEYLISGKFYDYMRSGKAVLHIGKEKSLMADFINRFDLGTVCENQVDKLQKEILDLTELWREGKLVRDKDNQRYIGQFARDYQNNIYQQIINKVSVCK